MGVDGGGVGEGPERNGSISDGGDGNGGVGRGSKMHKLYSTLLVALS